jgi:hypothetical protein
MAGKLKNSNQSIIDRLGILGHTVRKWIGWAVLSLRPGMENLDN